jgi:hypothetical protein
MANGIIARIIDNMSSEHSHQLLTFDEFIGQLRTHGDLMLRSIFQVFHDMVHHYITDVIDEYPGDAESVGFLKYDLNELFINNTAKPFFADRLFANRLVNLAKSFRMAAAPQKIYVFKGPAGSGKSTFLNNLLDKLETYVRSDEGKLYEIVWRIPVNEKNGPIAPQTSLYVPSTPRGSERENVRFFEVPCPNHDSPLLMIPVSYRADVIRDVIGKEDFRKRLFKHKQYQWVFKDEPCTICSSIFNALSERYSIEEVFRMMHARRYLFNRKQGVGISVFNSGDEVEKVLTKTNEKVQQFLNEFFKDSNKVPYLFSGYASTNQGVRALMDLKARNVQRFLDLHGIISDEVHKVGDIEERIKSLFIVLMNPEDLDHIAKNPREDRPEVDTSLKDRIHEILVPYVLDYTTEIQIYNNTYGEQIKLRFMPHVLENFGKTIIASRIKSTPRIIRDWLKDTRMYEKICDPDFLILKMDLYTGIIPDWLSKEDRGGLKAEVRKNILADSEVDGHDGFSGRESLGIFNEFYTRYAKKRPISMRHLEEFFMDETEHYREKIPRDFIKHLIDLYDSLLLKEVKDSMYAYNEDEISRSIINYLVGIVHNIGDTVKNPYLQFEEFLVTADYLDIVERHLVGYSASTSDKEKFRQAAVHEYASVTLSREIKVEGKRIQESKQYLDMFSQFTRTARESVLEPYVGNTNFRQAVKEFDTADFEKYDTKIRERVALLFKNLHDKYDYSIECAKVAIVYVLDKNLVEKFK